MKLSLNPFKLRRQVKYYAALYAKQCRAMIDTHDHIAELIAENVQLQQKTDDLTQSLKHAKFEIQRYQAIEHAVTVGKGFSI